MDECILCGVYVPQGEDVCPNCYREHFEIILSCCVTGFD